MLPRARSRCLQKLLRRGVDGQVVPHVFGVDAQPPLEVNSSSDHEVSTVIDERGQITLRKANTTTDVKEPFAVILGVR
jgi:hypothetical protein